MSRGFLGRLLWVTLALAWRAVALGDAGVVGQGVGAGTGVAEAAADGGADGGARAGATPPTAVGLEAQRAAIDGLIAGHIPEAFSTTQLFLVDLRDEASVARRRPELAQQILRLSSVDGGRPVAADGGVRDGSLLDAERHLLEARLRFLSLPAARRAELLDAEADAQARAVARQAAAQVQAAAIEERAAAEAAQREALEAASQADEAESRALATERARLESIRIEQASQKADIAARRTQQLEQAQSELAQSQNLDARSAALAKDSAAADELYDELVKALVVARRELRDALDALGEVPPQPRAELAAIATSGSPASAPARAELRELADTLNTQATALERDERSLRFEATEAAADRVRALNDTRLALLPKLTAEKRGRVLGLGPDGREQFLRELEQVRLTAAWRRQAEGPILVKWLKGLTEPFVLAEVIVRALALLGLLVLSRFLSKNVAGWLRLSRTLIVRHARRPTVARWGLNVIDAVAAIAPELVFLVTVLILGVVLRPLLDRAILKVPYAIAVDYALYRLAIRTSHRLIGWLAWTPVGALSEDKSERVLKSVRLVGRYAFALHVFFVVSETILGRGYLYSVVSRFGWLGGLPIAWFLMKWWRQDIGDGYLKLQPDGTLSRLVRASRERWYAFLIAVAALGVVFVAWVGRAARRFVLRFDQTRKALAYVFRKRLERRAGERGEDQEEVAPPTIPAEVMARFQPTPVDGDPFAIDRYPELDEFKEAIDEWRQREDQLGAWLVVGRTGFGKTSWLNAAAAHVSGQPLTRIDLRERIGDEAGVVAAIAGPLGVEARTTDELAKQILAGPRRAVFVDELQNLMLRGVGGLEAWEAFDALMRQVGPHVFWLSAIAYQPFQYLEWSRRGHGSFRHVVRLKHWSESEIRELIEARTLATGWVVSYQDLLVARIDDRSAGEQVVQTAQEFTRLIWDYSEGSPRVALDCWARSLSHDGDKQLRVKLFPRPRDPVLEAFDDVGRFALAAVVWHENVSAVEAALALGLKPEAVHDALRRLAEEGVLGEATPGRYRVTVPWWPVVNRFLIRKHLIVS